MALPDNAGIRIIIARFSSIPFGHYGRAYVVTHLRTCCKDGRRTGARVGREGGRVIIIEIIIIIAYNIRISVRLPMISWLRSIVTRFVAFRA
jgi:hypothetical protein